MCVIVTDSSVGLSGDFKSHVIHADKSSVKTPRPDRFTKVVPTWKHFDFQMLDACLVWLVYALQFCEQLRFVNANGARIADSQPGSETERMSVG